jgi:pSer/pThr/pTyr-binding forkhead associated (FHA) protein
LCPEQITSVAQGTPIANGSLVDAFGYIHRLGPNIIIGRSPKGQCMFVRDSSVSREHAQIRQNDGGEYEVRDLSSKNGTFLNDSRVDLWMPLVDGDRVRIGEVEFYFSASLSGFERQSRDNSTEVVIPEGDLPTTAVAADMIEGADEGLEKMYFELLEPRGGGGGFLKLDELVVPLTIPQLELLRALSTRMLDDGNEPEIVRGYVRSQELLAYIPWDTQHPTENHLKQLIVRIRRSLARAGVDNLIESRRRLGYRLRVIPTQAEPS